MNISLIIYLISLLIFFNLINLINPINALGGLNYLNCTTVPAPCIRISILVSTDDSVPNGPLNYQQVLDGINLFYSRQPAEVIAEFIHLIPQLQGYDIWNKKINQNGGIPVYDNLNTKVNLQLDYYNVGLNWAFATATDYSGILRVYQVVGEIIAGMYGRYPFIIPPLGLDDFVRPTCEATQQCICISSLDPAPASWVCGENYASQPGCHRANSRRYKYSISVMFDPTYTVEGHFEKYHAKGYSKVAIFTANDEQTLATFTRSVDNMKLYGLTLNYVQHFNAEVVDATVWSQQDCDNMITQMQIKGIEIVVFIEISGRLAAKNNFVLLLQRMEALNFMPKGLSAVGVSFPAVKSSLPPKYTAYFLYSIPFVATLNGEIYNAYNTSYNLEVFPTTATESSPQVYANELSKLYNNDIPYDIHKLFFAVTATEAMILIQKMVELSNGIDDVNTFITTAESMSVPSIFGQAQLDTFHRFMKRDFIVTQIDINGDSKYISPLNLPNLDLISLPVISWSERIYTYTYISSKIETVTFIITMIIICAVILASILTFYYRNNPVMKSSTPLFLHIFFLGNIILLISNLLWFPDSGSDTCVASAWLITTGFTLVYGSLFLKTLRIFLIFDQKRLNVVKIKNSQLLIILFFILLIDIIVNTIAQITGSLDSSLIVVDPLRISLNYHNCFTNSNASWYLLFVLIFKSIFLLLGLRVVYLARHVPSKFNESNYIGYAMYSIFVILVLMIALLPSNALNNASSYLVRAFGFILIVCSNIIFLFVTKLYVIWDEAYFNSVSYHTKMDTDKNDSTNTQSEHLKLPVIAIDNNGNKNISVNRNDTGNDPILRNNSINVSRKYSRTNEKNILINVDTITEIPNNNVTAFNDLNTPSPN